MLFLAGFVFLERGGFSVTAVEFLVSPSVLEKVSCGAVVRRSVVYCFIER